MKDPYYPTAFGLYFNHLVHGIGAILVSLNMVSLEALWQTNVAGVSIVTSPLGTGRLSILLFVGLLSDCFGRRPFIMLGVCCYMTFFSSILHISNITIAYVFGFLAEMANSFLDADTYPSLMEAFPRLPSTANILTKAFVSSGRFLLPLVISLLVWAELWFSWSFMIATGIMFINALFLYRCTFPSHPDRYLPVIKKTTNSMKHRCSAIDLVSYSLYDYVSMATFYLVSQWLTQYGQFIIGMSYTMSVRLLSICTVGSLLCVFITAPPIRNTVCPTTLLALYTFILFIALLTVRLHLAFYVVIILAPVIDFTSVGSVIQTDLTLMAERFPYIKRKATGICYSAGSITTFAIPSITAHLS